MTTLFVVCLLFLVLLCVFQALDVYSTYQIIIVYSGYERFAPAAWILDRWGFTGLAVVKVLSCLILGITILWFAAANVIGLILLILLCIWYGYIVRRNFKVIRRFQQSRLVWR